MSGDPRRAFFYPELKEYLSEALPDFNGEKLNYKIGDEVNVLHVYPADGGKVDLVLLTETEFKKQESK